MYQMMKMSSKAILILLVLYILTVTAPPVTKKPSAQEQAEEPIENYMEYHRYLKEVVGALESDPEFKKKLEQAEEADIRSGNIANHLEFVSHQVRTKLDEIKRTEMERLKSLVEKKNELTDGNSIDDPSHGHLDHSNPYTFEIEDLRKLIVKTTEDLAEADRRRREEFKRYEMQKEVEKIEKLNHTAGEEREKLEKQYKELEEKHKKHEPLHEPGHKAQLEEVWEKQDHMEQDFDPKTFFMLHDLDSNGLWDENEVKALFVKELDKMYAAGAPEDDMAERIEEMERMRETVFRDIDKNHDNFIDYNEFVAQTKDPNYQVDHGWQGLDENKPYTDEELQEYMRQYQMQHGYYPQQPPPGYIQNSQYQMHPNQIPPQGYQPYQDHVPQYQGHPPPQGYQQQPPPQGYQNQVPHQGQNIQVPHQNQVPPQNSPNQVPPQGSFNQVPHQGSYNQVPSQGSPNQVPPQGSFNQVPPQGSYNQVPPQNSPNQVPPQGSLNQVPPQGSYNQVPPQGSPNQVPPQGSFNQVPPQGSLNQPSSQGSSNQVPQQQQHQAPVDSAQKADNVGLNSVNLNQPQAGHPPSQHPK